MGIGTDFEGSSRFILCLNTVRDEKDPALPSK